MFDGSVLITRDILFENGNSSGTLGNIRGSQNELRFLDAWNSIEDDLKPYFWWFDKVTLHTPEQDRVGIDAVMHTGIAQLEEIGIQIKSGYGGIGSFKARHPDIPVVVVKDPPFNRYDIRRDTYLSLIEMYSEFKYFIKQHKFVLRGFYLE